MKEEKRKEDFQKVIHERYKNQPGSNPEMGGSIGDSGNSSNNENIVLYSVIGILGATSIGLFFRNRKLKNKQL